MGNFSDPVYIVFAILMAIPFVCALLSLLIEITVMHKEVQQGKQTLWYKRPLLVMDASLMLIAVAFEINLSTTRQHLISDTYLYIVDGILVIAGLACPIYGFTLQKKKLKRSQ